MAGFAVSINGRFWVSTEANTSSGIARHQAHAAMPDLARLRSPLPSLPLIQFPRGDTIRAPNARIGRRLSRAAVVSESRRGYMYCLSESFLRQP
jgi:hypothetical protein